MVNFVKVYLFLLFIASVSAFAAEGKVSAKKATAQTVIIGDVGGNTNITITQSDGSARPHSLRKSASLSEFDKLQQSANQGISRSQYNLGNRYLVGDGTQKDPLEAIKWLLKAANQDFLLAQIALGQIYHNGIVVPKNLVEAEKWYAKAKKLRGIAPSQESIHLIGAFNTPHLVNKDAIIMGFKSYNGESPILIEVNSLPNPSNAILKLGGSNVELNEVDVKNIYMNEISDLVLKPTPRSTGSCFGFSLFDGKMYTNQSSYCVTFLTKKRKPNIAPVLRRIIPDITVSDKSPFTYSCPRDTFYDANGDSLILSATQGNWEPLPTWLMFDPESCTFFSTSDTKAIGSMVIRLKADDGKQEWVSTDFMITVVGDIRTDINENSRGPESASTRPASADFHSPSP